MSKIKLNIEREEVSSEEIKGRRNFDALMNEFKASPKVNSKSLYKNKYFYTAICTVVLTLSLLFYLNYRKTNKEVTTLSDNEILTEATPFINPPFRTIEIPNENLYVIAEKGGVLISSSGSVLKVPANAFQDESGNSVSGEVTLLYREFKDPIDILVSGIPMNYDSAGIAMQLESAGMFELKGMQNGKNILLKKNISVEMVSANPSTKFNQYYLDTVSKAWTYLGKDKVINNLEKKKVYAVDTASLISVGMPLSDEFVDGFGEGDPLEVNKSQFDALKKLTEKIKKEEPIRPIKAKSQNYRFDLDILPEEFPELKDYKGLKFEVGLENKTFSEKLYSIVWDDVKLDYNTPGKNYKITFVKDNKIFEFVVYPVYEGKDSVNVLALYQKKYKVYAGKLKERLDEEKKAKEAWEVELKRQEQERKEFIEMQKKTDNEFLESNTALNYSSIMRLFSISKFGIYNSDCAFLYPDRITLTASYFCQGVLFTPKMVYMIDAGKNTLVVHYNNSLFYSPSIKNMLFAVLPDNKLAVFSHEEFKNIHKVYGKYIINMKKSEESFGTIKEMKEFLLNNKLK